MTSTNFAFWLNGYFELSQGKITGLSEKQIQIIKNHLNLVFETVKTPDQTKDISFCTWLNNFLEGAVATSASKKSINPNATQVIKNKLSEVFEHVIDPTFSSVEEVRKALQEIHDAGSPEIPRNNDIRVLC